MVCGCGAYVELLKWGMEILASYSNWVLGETKNTLFENLINDEETPDMWQKVENTIPGKAVVDDNSDIDSFFTLDCVDEPKQLAKPSHCERRKVIPWTEEEHRLFLLGIEKYGKGDWRNISRNFVMSRTPTQVASHAQKYFIRQRSECTKWTPVDKKLFENALVIYDKETPDRWVKIANMIPGKCVMDVCNQYKELVNDVSDIDAGLNPIPGCTTSFFKVECVNELDLQSYGSGMKGTALARPFCHEKKKGIPWTEEEHRLFLLGLTKYGKGDWRNISRNFVLSRTPTQVARHAQKYFLRQQSGGKDKRISSIHDITTANCLDDTTSPNKNKPPSPDTMLLENLK